MVLSTHQKWRKTASPNKQCEANSGTRSIATRTAGLLKISLVKFKGNLFMALILMFPLYILKILWKCLIITKNKGIYRRNP